MFPVFQPPLPDDNFESVYWSEVYGSALPLALTKAALAAPGPILLLCTSFEAVERCVRELRFFAAADELPVLGLPDWETLPYDSFSPHQDIISERLTTLYNMPSLDCGIVVLSITSLMHRLPPRHYIAGNTLHLEQGQQLSIDGIRHQMTIAGYQAVETVMEHGEFAVRGSIVDLFPMGSPVPYRLDLFDDELDSIRLFDPETQRSHEKISRIELLPGREYPLDEDAITRFRTGFRNAFDVDTRQCPIYQDVGEGIYSPGLEYYLPLFFEELSTLLDFLPESTIICRAGDLKVAGDIFWSDIQKRYQDRYTESHRPVLQPEQVFVPIDDVL
ncbi:MAG: transcription-repair coupling factor, partial [Gammaproteobacteria bacterium]|nr:transcription-repair coupling factor [Gammaproteobacteria bacterium]